jgi:hypothetical protein
VLRIETRIGDNNVEVPVPVSESVAGFHANPYVIWDRFAATACVACAKSRSTSASSLAS